MKSRRIVAVATLLAAVLGAAASRAAAQPPPVTHSVNLAALKASSVLVQKGAQTVPVAAAAATVQIAPWQYVVARREGGVARVEPMTAGSPDRPAWALPLTLVTVNAEGVQLELQPIVEAGDGLMMRGAGSAFTGALHVGVRNTVNPTGTQLLVRASFVQEAFTIPVPVRRPRLVLEISPPSIQGFGVDTAVVSVRMEGVQDAAGRSVSLASTQGRLDPAPAVTLDAQGTASATLRSESVGPSTVTASAGGVQPQTGTVAYVWPVRFLVFSLLGGCAGAFLKRGTASGKKSKGSWRWLAVGAVSGLVLAVATAIGINLLPWQPTATMSEALVFGVAALGTFLGAGALITVPDN
ncbi:MAG: Ig-like domain-containing protein [Vicinamibacterales bacterium]|nr:Ig-like domain-containing protein [Vicinamibacterales bacterium]